MKAHACHGSRALLLNRFVVAASIPTLPTKSALRAILAGVHECLINEDTGKLLERQYPSSQLVAVLGNALAQVPVAHPALALRIHAD